jgi:hypothetical protein
MGICDFDYDRLFRDKDWEGDWIDHYSDAALWAEAIVSDSCPICTVLWQKLQDASRPPRDVFTQASSEARKQHIEDALSMIDLPFFRVRLRKMTGDEFLLNFDPRSRDAAPQVGAVNFSIYPLDGKLSTSLENTDRIC